MVIAHGASLEKRNFLDPKTPGLGVSNSLEDCGNFFSDFVLQNKKSENLASVQLTMSVNMAVYTCDVQDLVTAYEHSHTSEVVGKVPRLDE